MANSFRITGTTRSVDVKSQQQVQDVMVVHAETIPSGVSFTRAVPYANWQKSGAGAALAPIAQHIEHILAVRPSVVAASGLEQVGANGLLANAVEFVVQVEDDTGSGNGPFQDHVIIPVQVLHDRDSFDAYFDPVLDRLRAAAAA